MSGHFVVKSKKKLAEMNEGDRIETSDYAQITPEGFFVQLEYKEEDGVKSSYKVKPGIFSIQKNAIEGMHLTKTSFSGDDLLPSIINTQEIKKRADCFFRNIHLYKDLGYDVAKRNMLIYGPAGTGKTSTINLIAQDYAKDGNTAVVSWTTDKF
jgi:AAA+ superfamily predicted ATPase